MFIGSINQYLRDILNEMAAQWRGLPVYVGCSGNFTVERILSRAGLNNIFGNDVSLYSCMVGRHLTGCDMPISISRAEFSWLEEYLNGSLDKIACLLVCSAYFEFIDKNTPYHKRMEAHYRNNFKDLHSRSVEKVKKAVEGVSIQKFYAMDVMDYMTSVVPREKSVVISFPPTYSGGYERLYKKIDGVFSWQKPAYKVFTNETFNEFTAQITSREHWVTLRDHEVESLSQYLVGIVQSGMRQKPVYVYSSSGRSHVILPKQRIEPLNVTRLGAVDDLQPKISFSRITQGQMNLLRSEYLSKKIVPAGAELNIAVLNSGNLIGAAAFSRSEFDKNGVYMMTDFPISPTKYSRLAKLILAVVFSEEMKIYLQNRFSMEVKTISTTAFTDKPVSMKYRGIMELYNRKPGMLNYVAPAGKWTLEEGFVWWMKNHSKK